MGTDFTKEQIERLGSLLLKIGSLLMSSGANSMRIRVTLDRVATAFGFHAELLITHRALMINLQGEDQNHAFNMLKRTSPHGVNFRLVSGISKMSWNIVKGNWTIDAIDEELDRLQALPHYPRIIILTFVSLADVSFCRLFGGGAIEMAIAFVATFIGLIVRQETTKKKYNAYMCMYLAALTSSLISGLAVKYNIGTNPQYAFATSVLYLIPGVPLINSFSDLMYGNIMNGIVRGINGMTIVFAIALGLTSALFIYQI